MARFPCAPPLLHLCAGADGECDAEQAQADMGEERVRANMPDGVTLQGTDIREVVANA